MLRIAFEMNKFIDVDATTLAGYNFSGYDLHRAILNGYCLDGVIFENANLRNVRIEYVSAIGSNFINAALMNSFLDFSNLSESDFTKSRPIGANMASAILTGCKFDEADVWHANFSQANLCGASLLFKRFDNINVNGALFDNNTMWPEGFDPIAHGAIMI